MMASTNTLNNPNPVKLSQPKELPDKGVTSALFKPWKNRTVAYLCQNLCNKLFFPGGDYEKWSPAIIRDENHRLTELKGKDLEYPTEGQILAKACEGAVVGYIPTAPEKATAKQALKKERLDLRNSQLSMLLQQLAQFCYYTEQDDVAMRSDSIAWVWKYLEAHYNIEAKGANFLRIVEHTYKQGENYSTFYKQFRASFLDNLRKAGCKGDPRDPGARLAEDEKLSPSHEDSIILWTLERIDPRLPSKVRQDYEGRLFGDTYLWDLQPMIFQAIPRMLNELDNAAKLASYTAMGLSSDNNDYQVVAAAAGGYQGSRISGRGRSSSTAARGRGRGGGGRGRISPATGETWTDFYCRLCHKVRKEPPAVYTSHNTSQCSNITVADCKEILASLQVMISGDATEEDEGDRFEDLGQGEDGQGLDENSS